MSSTKRKPKIKRFENRQIASITEPYTDENGLIDVRVISKGMTKEEIEKEFPPDPLSVSKAEKKGLPIPTFNMRMLIRSMILQEYEVIGENRERGNVRHFFYTNIIYTLMRVMEVNNISSLNTTINAAWRDVIESGMVTYEGMNIESAKDKWLRSFAKHSPFSNYIICVEKESLLESLSWVAELFRTTIVTAGGQPSRAAIRAFIRTLADWKCDLDLNVFLLVITDLDPAGWYIQEAFASQILKSLKYYNEDKGVVNDPIRLFLRLDQVTEKLIGEFAVPAKDQKAKTSQALKSSDTKIEKFKKKLGDKWETLVIDGEMHKIELDAISTDQMERKIVHELIDLIEDHSLILIPEIMDELEKQRKEVIKEIFQLYKEETIDESIDEYLNPIEDKKSNIESEYREKQKEIDNDYSKIFYLVDTIKRSMRLEIETYFDALIEKYEEYSETLVEDEREEIEGYEEDIEELERQIDNIREKINDLEEEIDDKIGFYKEEISELEDKKREQVKNISDKQDVLLKPAKVVKDKETKEIQTELELFNEKYGDFRSQQEGKFGSYLRSVEKQFEDGLNSEQIPIYFEDVEKDFKAKNQMAYLLNQPKLLLEKNKRCLEHPIPAFKETEILNDAISPENYKSTRRNPDLSKFRNAFSTPFVLSLKELVSNKLKIVDVSLDGVIDKPSDFDDELDALTQEIKDKIKKDRIYSLLKYHPEDLEDSK